MRRRLDRNRIGNILSENYFWIMIAGYLTSLIYPGFSVVILSGLLFILLFVLNWKKNVTVSVTAVYFFYLSASVFLYMGNERPVSLYITAVAYIVLPMIMFMIPKENGRLFYQKAMNAIFVSLLLAVILYIWAPEFYAEYLYNRDLIGRPYVDWIKPSLIQGLYGITTVGIFATCCALYYFMQTMEKKQFSMIKFVICVLIVLYTQRRSAIAALGIGVLMEMVVCCRHGKFRYIHILILYVLAGLGLLALLFFHKQFVNLVFRVLAVQEAVLERTGNWADNLNGMGWKMILGNGLGSYGHLAGALGYPGVFDSQYILTLVENGITGTALFGLSVCMAFYRFSAREGEKLVAMLIVVVFLIQCIGSNVLEMPLPAALFWYSLSYMESGRTNGKTKSKRNCSCL